MRRLAGGSLGRTAWELCPTLGIAWQTPSRGRTSDFVYQELRFALGSAHPPACGSADSCVIPAWQTWSSGPSHAGGRRTAARFRRSGCHLWEPENRILDFGSHRATTVDQEGVDSITCEVKARTTGDERLATKILEYSVADGIMIEQLEPGFNLAIYGMANRFHQPVQSALARWRKGTVRRVSFAEYVEIVEEESPRVLNHSDWQGLLAESAGIETLDVAASHGDLQPSNVLQTRSGDLLLLDFEHFATRSADYDMTVFSELPTPSSPLPALRRQARLDPAPIDPTLNAKSLFSARFPRPVAPVLLWSHRTSGLPVVHGACSVGGFAGNAPARFKCAEDRKRRALGSGDFL